MKLIDGTEIEAFSIIGNNFTEIVSIFPSEWKSVSSILCHTVVNKITIILESGQIWAKVEDNHGKYLQNMAQVNRVWIKK